MKGRTRASNRCHVEKVGKEAADSQLSKEVIVGDLLWVKLHGSSWWPAQVVDENTVSASNKPSKRSRGDVLVRLYGSYKYMYANSNTYRLEFENILTENNGSYSEILKKALEQARVTPKISIRSTQPTKVKNGNLLSDKPEKVRSKKRKQEGEQKKVEPNSPKSARFSPEGKSKKRKLDGVHKTVDPNTPNTVSLRCHSQATTSVGSSQELSARRIKVMQSLGLIAPSGSPFPLSVD